MFSGPFFRKAELNVFVVRRLPALQNVRQQGLVQFRERKAAELLGRRDERNVAHHLQCRQNGFGFGVAHIAHLEAAAQDRTDVKEAAVNASEDHVAHVVDVDVAAVGEFFFAPREIELTIEALREEPLDERTLGRNEGRIEVRILTVAETQNIIRILTQLLEGLRVVVLVVAVFGIRRRNILEAKGCERTDHELVKFGHGHLFARLQTFRNRVRHGEHGFVRDLLVAAEGCLHDGLDDLLRLEVFKRIVFLEYLEHRGFHSFYLERSAV